MLHKVLSSARQKIGNITANPKTRRCFTRFFPQQDKKSATFKTRLGRRARKKNLIDNNRHSVSFPWNFFISREAATAERRYEKER
jgi:hypothetical protein